MLLKPQDVILFQGDSITDAGRVRETLLGHDVNPLGRGYVMLTAADLLASQPGMKLTFFNRGISGDKVTDLAARWNRDCLAMKPNVVSILIGVNDTWHGLGGRGEGIPLDQYETTYRQLIKQTLEALAGVRLVLCEPFVLRCGAVDHQFFPEIDQRREIVRRLSKEFKTLFVPFQQVFNEACLAAPALDWLGDGVHPTLAGHRLMAKAWIDAVIR